MAKAVPLVHVNSDQKLELHDEGKLALQSAAFLHQNLAVVSVVGPARGGKSTLINNLLKCWGVTDPNFQASDGMGPCTSGIWMWSVPLPLPGVESHLVILDVEGSQIADTSCQDTHEMYCIAYLLSSLLVWNQQGPVTLPSLRELATLQEATNILRSSAMAGSSNEAAEGGAVTETLLGRLRRVLTGAWRGARTEPAVAEDQADTEALDEEEHLQHLQEVSEHGPQLLWVMQGGLQLPEKLKSGEDCTCALDYLNECLAQGCTARSREDVKTLKGIMAMFPVGMRDAVKLPPPCALASDCARLNELELQDLLPGYVSGLKEVAGKIKSAVQQPRVTLGTAQEPLQLTGELLSVFLEEVCGIINNKGIIDIQAAVIRAAGQNNQALASSLLQRFKDEASATRGSADFVRLRTPGGVDELLADLKVKQACFKDMFVAQAIKVYDIALELASLNTQMDEVVAQRESELHVIVAAVMQAERQAAKQTEQEVIEYIHNLSHMLAAEWVIKKDGTIMSEFDTDVKPKVNDYAGRVLEDYSEGLAQTLRTAFDTAMQSELKAVCQWQDARNKELMALVAGNLYHIYGPSDKTVVTANTDMPEKGKLRLRDPNSESQATFLFLDDRHRIMVRPPKDDDVFALYVPAEKQICVLEVKNKEDYFLHRVTSRFWLEGCRMEDNSLPRSSKLKAVEHQQGKFTAFYSLHIYGYVRRKVNPFQNFDSITAQSSGDQVEDQHIFYFKHASLRSAVEKAMATIQELVQTGSGVRVAPP